MSNKPLYVLVDGLGVVPAKDGQKAVYYKWKDKKMGKNKPITALGYTYIIRDFDTMRFTNGALNQDYPNLQVLISTSTGDSVAISENEEELLQFEKEYKDAKENKSMLLKWQDDGVPITNLDHLGDDYGSLFKKTGGKRTRKTRTRKTRTRKTRTRKTRTRKTRTRKTRARKTRTRKTRTRKTRTRKN
jgi:hypothetical protein